MGPMGLGDHMEVLGLELLKGLDLNGNVVTVAWGRRDC